MPPQLAALIFILFIAYLFWVDIRKTSNASNALWIPLIWMLLGGSRFVSQWLNLGVPASKEEGSAIDAVVFFILILAGVMILMRREVNGKGLFKQNAWIWLYFCFGLVSILWSDFPFVSFKRLVKALGNVIMVLVILTEERPYEAFGTVLRRFSFLLLPLSILFIKYYPELGRGYHMGIPMNNGVSTQKNGLGQICLLSAVYFSWSLLLDRRNEIESGQTHLPKYIIFIILAMVVWLLSKADSATSTACVAISVCLFFVARQSVMIRQPTRIFYFTISGIVILGVLEMLFGISAEIIVMLGRRPDLTTRVPMWQDLIAMAKYPITGFGYESFWLGQRQELIRERWSIDMQAHNGYLEMYLNMGLIGLFFLFSWALSGLKKIKHCLSIDYPVALLRFCFVLVVLISNWTEATFYGISIMWMMLLLGVMEVPIQHPREKVLSEHPDQKFTKPKFRYRVDNTLAGNKNKSSLRKQSQRLHQRLLRK